jgi:hypothetical protein
MNMMPPPPHNFRGDGMDYIGSFLGHVFSSFVNIIELIKNKYT